MRIIVKIIKVNIFTINNTKYIICLSSEGDNKMIYIIASSNMGKVKDALGYRPAFMNTNDFDTQIDLTGEEFSIIYNKLCNDRYFKIRAYRKGRD